MCGITGFIGADASTPGDGLARQATVMAETLRHRGPDASGVWTDAAAGVALAFRRLSIIDLSPTGDQPMVSPSGRYVLVFNGEVYNYRELRAELKAAGETFRGTSDTEVLLATIWRHGVQEALRRANAMFGLAVWDAERRVLTLARDRFGEKPLYYGWTGRSFVFGSELKALWAHPEVDVAVDRRALALYLRYGYVPAPHSIMQGVAKVVPGGSVEVSPDRVGEVHHPDPYYSLRNVVERAARDRLDLTDREAVERADELLRASVAARMVADVPLGAFLSGGIDSSTVVALMQAQAPQPVRTFTIGFHEFGLNEAEHAKRVAAHLGTDHTELYLSESDAMAVVPALPAMYDEPFADSSQIPTHLVARMARHHVTVCLSGDGGDEVFAGYNRHVFHHRVLEQLGRLPGRLRRAIGASLRLLPPEKWDWAIERVEPVLPRRLRGTRIGEKIRKFGDVVHLDAAPDVLRQAASQWSDPGAAMPGASEYSTLLTDPAAWPQLSNATELMVYLDTITYLPDDILAKVDRATMAVSLEARVPYLDPAVVEFSWRLPLDLKIRNGRGKWLLRRVLDRYVPEELVLRPKAGFAVPLAGWLRGPLREWADDLLDPRSLRDGGYFDAGVVRAAWEQHASGQRDNRLELWTVLMFQAWLAGATRPPA